MNRSIRASGIELEFLARDAKRYHGRRNAGIRHYAKRKFNKRERKFIKHILIIGETQ